MKMVKAIYTYIKGGCRRFEEAIFSFGKEAIVYNLFTDRAGRSCMI
jgi:hypothetical protein